MICYNYVEWCLDIRLWSRKKMKDVTHIEKNYSSISKSRSYFSAIKLWSQDSTKRYLTVMCKKAYKGDQKVKNYSFSVQNGKNKNMTTFQIVWSYPKKILVVIRQKLRTANFFSDHQIFLKMKMKVDGLKSEISVFWVKMVFEY